MDTFTVSALLKLHAVLVGQYGGNSEVVFEAHFLLLPRLKQHVVAYFVAFASWVFLGMQGSGRVAPPVQGGVYIDRGGVLHPKMNVFKKCCCFSPLRYPLLCIPQFCF